MTILSRMLSSFSNLQRKPLVSGSHPALTIPVDNPAFVEPPLKLKHPSDELTFDYPLVLISAPGAVGKSTLASHIAANRAAALWDLSRLSLGDNTFIGTLANSFGPAQLSSVLSGLVKGESLFVFDAFDEAELLSGWDRVETFVREIWSFVSNASKTAAVLLARTETAMLLDLLLQELAVSGKVKHLVLEIDYFDEQSARLFLDKQLSEVFRTNLHQQHSTPFRGAVDAVFDVLAHALSIDKPSLWFHSAGRTFLGYAPVLQAIAAHLALYTNFEEAINSLKEVTGADAQKDLLSTLMRKLTFREQSKFINPLKEKPQPGSEASPLWEELYSEKEQLRRLFLYMSNDEDAFEVGPLVPGWLAPAYEDALRAFLPSHPFLRGRDFTGPAFRDFVFASLLPDQELGPFVELRLEEFSFVLTPLFAEFYRSATEIGLGRHAGFVYESALARFGLHRASLETVFRPEEDGEVHVLSITPDQEGQEDLEFRMQFLVSSVEPLTFHQRVRNATINANGAIVLSSQVSFELSDVEIQSDSIDIKSNVLVVRGQPKNRVLLQAKNPARTLHPFRIEVKPGSELLVDWPGASRYPWANYHKADLFLESLDREGALLALRRILVWFRRDRREELARYKDLIDNVAVGHSSTRRVMRDFLLDKGILRLDGRLYKLDTEVANTQGINWVSLRRTSAQAELHALLDEFLEFSDGRA